MSSGTIFGTRTPQRPMATDLLPLVYWAGLRRVGRVVWWPDLARECQRPHCGGSMTIEEPVAPFEGRIFCLQCGRETARIAAEGWGRWFTR